MLPGIGYREALSLQIYGRKISDFSRVDRFLPIRQVDVCFLRLPPGFPAVPQYFKDCRLYSRMVLEISHSLSSGRVYIRTITTEETFYSLILLNSIIRGFRGSGQATWAVSLSSSQGSSPPKRRTRQFGKAA